MKKRHGVLLVLVVSCGQKRAEHSPSERQPAPQVVAARPANAVHSAARYTSGDRLENGPNDTLHVGSLVLQLLPGNKRDFAKVLIRQLPFSEARAIRQAGDGRVRRIGHTLLVRPFNGPVLRFSDNTHQMRRDDNEEMDSHCQFSGSVPGRPYWVVDSLQWERYQPFLVNKNSGRATLLSWEPEISPNRRFLFVGTPGLELESSLNGLELLAISDQEVRLVWTKVLRNWQPHQVRWLDNHTLAIEQLRFQPQEHTTYVRLLLPN